jgi:putative cardiolipin synthase
MIYLLLALGTLVAGLAVYIYGFLSAPKQGLPGSAIAASESGTFLDRSIKPLLDDHPGESGLCLLTDNLQAFALRAATARKAERSLDLQYYYWKDDLTGSLLAHEVIQAADRGVRVRLLIDDISSRSGDRNYLALEKHPNIQVRLFNPTRCRDSNLMRGAELLLRYWSVNRRMHNKSWIVDNRLAVVGGRNIGDAYYDAAREANFRDMDVAAIGPVVEEASTVFDSYWNSSFVFPIRKLARPIKADLGRLRRRCEAISHRDRAQPYLQRVEEDRMLAEMRTGDWCLHWTSSAKIVADPPEKAASKQVDGWLSKVILSVLSSAKERVDLTSPYFIPHDSGTETLVRLASQGVRISVLTNSLAATDVAAVHGAYVRYREPLLRAGLRLFELKPRGPREHVSLFGSRGASLHTKAIVVDGISGFIGSFNFDPRSAALNTEMGLLFKHPQLAGEMLAVFSQETSPDRSYRVLMRDGRLSWKDDAGDAPMVFDHEPEASLRRRFVAWVISMLPLESQL